jgi:hypothetical protein
MLLVPPFKSDNLWIKCFLAASTSTWLQHIGHKFRDVLQVKARRMQDMPTSADAGTNVTIDVCTDYTCSNWCI